ncbi:hypothetical protein UPYG_G00054220, partial [Umbra pygmaea]
KRRLFTVTIRHLQLEDAGPYWCFIEAWTWNPKTELQLIVDRAPHIPPPPHPKPDPVTSRPVPSTTQPSTTNTMATEYTTVGIKGTFETTTASSQVVGTPGIITVCVSLAVLVLGLILILIYKCRRDRKASGPVTKPISSTQDSTYQILTVITQDSTYQTLNTT